MTEDFITDYMRMTARTEPSSIFRKWCAVYAICASMRRHTWIDMHERIFPNMYILLIGPPAARKGTAMKQASRLLEANPSFEMGDIPMLRGKTTPQRFPLSIKL